MVKLKLDTIIIFTQDIEQLKAFYADILGLKVIEEIKSEWLLLDAGHCNIGLHKAGKEFLVSGKSEFKVSGNTKIVFETEEDISELREELIKSKVHMRDIKTFDNYDFIVCDGEDPEGNVFQLKKRK